ncbi:hypothetical protein GCM10022289_19160 [Pedobacter jeongneungensis]|uniref:Late embryogenesis abundant protein n=1 Tax=Pedobacter jeongneungensis TaxID=947309 RepID=A0ABP8BCR4_9SPHI
MLSAQDYQPVNFSYSSSRISLKEALIIITADIKPGWRLYAQNNIGPMKLEFSYPSSTGSSALDSTTEPLPLNSTDETTGLQVNYFKDHVVFQQRIRTKTALTFFRGQISFTASKGDNVMGPITIPFSLMVR